MLLALPHELLTAEARIAANRDLHFRPALSDPARGDSRSRARCSPASASMLSRRARYGR